MAFLADKPINVISPICAYTLLVNAGDTVKCKYSAKCAYRHSQHYRKRHRPAFVQRRQEQEHKNDREQKNINGVVPALISS